MSGPEILKKTEELAYTFYINKNPSSRSRMAWRNTVRTEYHVDPNSQTLIRMELKEGERAEEYMRWAVDI